MYKRQPLIAAGGALIGWAGGFELIGWGTIATLAVLAIIGVIVDTVAQTAGAQKAGASSYGIWGSVIGTFVGVFMGGLVGIFIMPLVGAFIGEFLSLIHIYIVKQKAFALFNKQAQDPDSLTREETEAAALLKHLHYITERIPLSKMLLNDTGNKLLDAAKLKKKIDAQTLSCTIKSRCV